MRWKTAVWGRDRKPRPQKSAVAWDGPPVLKPHFNILKKYRIWIGNEKRAQVKALGLIVLHVFLIVQGAIFANVLPIICNIRAIKITDSYHKIFGLTRIGHYLWQSLGLGYFRAACYHETKVVGPKYPPRFKM
jgi:hypothetical protein